MLAPMKENNGERIQIPVPHDKPKDARLETDTAVSHLIRKRRIYACIAIAVILLGVGGILQPTTSALLHNTSTLYIGLKSMGNLLDEPV